MATGKPNGSNNKRSRDYELVYAGKKSKEKILSGLAAKPEKLFSAKVDNSPTWQNRLYWGDNYATLLHLLNDDEVCGKVRLIYIDSPFSTNSVFESRSLHHAYYDNVTGADFIESLRERLVLLYELLAENGSIYVHLDGNMAFQIKIIMDEIFGLRNFRNWITRKKCNRKNYTRKTYGNISDYILFYTKGDNYVWNRAYEPWTEEAIRREYPCIDTLTGRRYKKVPIHAPGSRNGETGKEWHGMMPPRGKHWQYTPTKLTELDAAGEIYWSPTGNPRRKIYAENSSGIPAQDIWMEFIDAHNQNIFITGYPTEKNPLMLDRIIEASSKENDLVLDCYSGSGTTLERANRLKRRWIGIDNGFEAIKTTLTRFSTGTKPMGDFVTERLQKDDKLMLFPEIERAEKPKASPEFKFNFDLFYDKESIDKELIPLIRDLGNNFECLLADPIELASNTA
jgi:adenine-specific DNA-methyltransferase